MSECVCSTWYFVEMRFLQWHGPVQVVRTRIFTYLENPGHEPCLKCVKIGENRVYGFFRLFFISSLVGLFSLARSKARASSNPWISTPPDDDKSMALSSPVFPCDNTPKK